MKQSLLQIVALDSDISKRIGKRLSFPTTSSNPSTKSVWNVGGGSHEGGGGGREGG